MFATSHGEIIERVPMFCGYLVDILAISPETTEPNV